MMGKKKSVSSSKGGHIWGGGGHFGLPGKVLQYFHCYFMIGQNETLKKVIYGMADIFHKSICKTKMIFLGVTLNLSLCGREWDRRR